MSKKMRWIIGMAGVILLSGAVILLYYYFLSRMPGQIHLRADSVQEINFAVPVKGKIIPDTLPAAAFPGGSTGAVEVDFSKPVKFTTGSKKESYLAKLKLFGILPYKNVEIHVSDELYMVPSGVTIGIYMQTEGVLVIDTGHFPGADGKEAAPAQKVLKPGDYICRVNGSAVHNKKEFMDCVAKSGGLPMQLEINRDGQILSESLVPSEDREGNYKVGIWVRDSTQGIGTVTYIDADGNYGALGHGVTDADTGSLMNLEKGDLYRTEIVSIVRGAHGTPGEVTGMIHYVSKNIIGSIEQNVRSGIYGKMEDNSIRQSGAAIPVAYKGEVQEGKAEIISSVDGTVQRYSIEITGINPADAGHRGLNIRVTDEKLLSLTGGIIQGMSGSPIIQNGKLVGAVTHVLVSDPEKGYGIFIEDMLEHDEE